VLACWLGAAYAIRRPTPRRYSCLIVFTELINSRIVDSEVIQKRDSGRSGHEQHCAALSSTAFPRSELSRTGQRECKNRRSTAGVIFGDVLARAARRFSGNLPEIAAYSLPGSIFGLGPSESPSPPGSP
jgi:hypothetical protein